MVKFLESSKVLFKKNIFFLIRNYLFVKSLQSSRQCVVSIYIKRLCYNHFKRENNFTRLVFFLFIVVVENFQVFFNINTLAHNYCYFDTFETFDSFYFIPAHLLAVNSSLFNLTHHKMHLSLKRIHQSSKNKVKPVQKSSTFVVFSCILKLTQGRLTPNIFRMNDNEHIHISSHIYICRICICIC